MKYRLADSNDKSAIYSLWGDVFGDSAEIIDSFYKTFRDNADAFVATDNDNVVSMLFLVHTEIVIDSEKYKACYVYAVATNENYRRRGIMTQLMSYAQSCAREGGAEFLFLRPATEKLYSYYQKQGFVTAFFESRKTITVDELESVNLRRFNFINWCDDVISLNAEMSDNASLFSHNGYAEIGKTVDDTVFIERVCTASPKALLNNIFTELNVKKINVALPFENTDNDKTGMLKSIGNIKMPDYNIYLGITLE